jgi:outer membrane protein OmpA-like peptidoglycan-associated protein
MRRGPKATRIKLAPNVLVLAALLAPVASHAQFFDMLKEQALKAAQKVIENKPADAPAVSAPEPAPAQPSPAAPAAAGSSNSQTAAAEPASLQAYQSYDFVPGDTIVFDDSFEKDDDGEFPAHWNQLDGQGAINTIAGRKVFAVTGGRDSQVSPAIKAAQYLPDSWTVELDTYATPNGYPPRFYFYPVNKVRGPERFPYSDYIGFIDVGRNNWSVLEIDTRNPADQADQIDSRTNNPDFMTKPGFFNQWHHIALAYKEGRLKIYVDQFRIFSLQDFRVHPKALAIGAGGEANKPGIIANVRIASGAGIKIVDKKFTDAKIVTHGINFDNDKATLKPESMGTLNMIVGILKNNPEIRFSVEGHTDNSGNAAHNLTLSQQRAEAVKQQLVSMGVETTRLTTKGLGDTKPIADNGSLEGRANNRRVEFVKIK